MDKHNGILHACVVFMVKMGLYTDTCTQQVQQMILPSIGWKFIRMHGREKYIYMHIYDFNVLMQL